MTNKNIQQTDIFSLFGIEDEYAIEQKKKEEERMKRQAEVAKQLKNNSKSTKPAKKESKFEVNAETTIYFYTEVIQITDYFTLEELVNGLPRKKKGSDEIEYKNISENDLKRRLKKDYPVLETGAQLVYIEKKNIVSIILQAKKKGLDKCSKEESYKGSFSSNTKIPFSLLSDFIAISKHYSDRYGTEVHADIFYDVLTEDFFMDIPKQEVHAVWVEVTEDPLHTALKTLERECIKVLEIHSHHSMSPKPSLQDDMSERSPILYAIVGRLDQFFPEITVRTYDIQSETHIPLSPWDIFDNPFNSLPSEYDISVVEVIE